MSGVVWLLNPHQLGQKGRKAVTKSRKAKTEKEAMARPSKKAAGKKKPRTAAQKAATARMLAANKKAASPAKPKKRRSYAKAAAVPAKRRYKRNPVAGKKGIMNTLIHDITLPAGVGIAGNLAVDAVWGNMKFIPLQIRTGKMRYLAKPALAIGAAIAVGKFAPKMARYANEFGKAVLLVNGYQAASELINSKFPNAGLAGYDDSELNEVIDQLNGVDGVDGMGEALPGSDLQGLDFYDHASDGEYAYA